MSKHGSSVEIEDVLASIRRLVTDDGRGSAARALQPKKVDPEDEGAPDATSAAIRANKAAKILRADRLILTPSQRVADQDQNGAEDAELANGNGTAFEADTGSAPILLTEPHRVDTPFHPPEAVEDPEDGIDAYAEPLESVAPDITDARADNPHDEHQDADTANWDDEAATDLILDAVDNQDDADRQEDEAVAAALSAMPEVSEYDEDDAYEDEGENAADGDQNAPNSVLAQVIRDELSAALGDEAPEAHRDADMTADRAPDPHASALRSTNAEAAQAAGQAEPFIRPRRPEKPERTLDAGAEARSPRSEPPRQGLSLEEKIAELEAMIGGNGAADWEDEPQGQGSNTGFAQRFSSPLEWEDAPRPEAIFQTRRAGQLSQIADDLDEEVPGEAPASPLAGLDEEALRELVAAVVRSELQGALGERITRNVRKLVRREIQRAMMSQNYE